MADTRVFDWLGVVQKQVPYYLHPLNLIWSAEGADYDLKVYRRVAEQLAADKAYWAEIIRENSWRHSLAGCTCLMASKRREFFPDLCFRFQAGSFIAPQLAVALGLLHNVKAPDFFSSLLKNQAIRANPKQAVSAHRVLLRLGVQPAFDVSADAWSGLERDDALTAEEVVADHWDFWSERVGETDPSTGSPRMTGCFPRPVRDA